MARPGFLHTSPVHVATFDALVTQMWPGVTAVHVVDETLLSDAVTHGPLSVADRVAARLASLRDQGADVVCCTCSTIGDVAERADAGIPVFRVDRPMAARAVGVGRRVGVVAALESTVLPTRDLLRQEARSAGRPVETSVVVVDGAWARFQAGDVEGYHARIAEATRRLAGSVDVVVLAQASMAGATALLEGLAVPVLTSPQGAVEHLATLL